MATFLFKRTPFTTDELTQLRDVSQRLDFQILYAPGVGAPALTADESDDSSTAMLGDYARLILAPDRNDFYAHYGQDVRPTTDDRPFFFHTTKLADQFDVAFGRTMLFGNGLSALMTLIGISVGLVGAVRAGAARRVGRRTGATLAADARRTSRRSAPGSCWSRSRCCSDSCCCSGIRSTR